MVYFFLFLFGLCFGSFLNVIIYRTTHGHSPFSGRSFCPHCQKKVAWFDNIPLLSFIKLGGRCRHCHQPIAFSYPLVELLTGIEFVWVWFLLKQNLIFLGRFEGFYSLLNLIYLLIIFYIFIGITVADFKYGLIPDSLVVSGIVLSVFFILTSYNFLVADFKSYFISGAGAALFFITLIIITRGKGMGWGGKGWLGSWGLRVGARMRWINSEVQAFLGSVPGTKYSVLGLGQAEQFRVPVRPQIVT